MKKRYDFVCIVCIMLYAANMLGQTCCSAGAPLTSTFQIAHEDQKTIQLELKYTYRSINRLVENREVLVNDPRTRLGNNLLLKADYAFNKKIAVSLVLPYVFQSRTTTSESQSSVGLGDMLLIGQYSQKVKEEYALSYSIGAKLPTGKVDHFNERGIFLSPDMQSGSGTFDFLFGINLGKKHFIKKNVSFNTSVLFRKNTTNATFGETNNSSGRSFKFGDEFIADITLAHQQLWGLWFASPYVNLQYRTIQANREEGTVSPNSGGQWLSAQAGVQLRTKENFSFRIYGQVPFFQALEGLQITTDYELGVSLFHNLALEKKKLPFE